MYIVTSKPKRISEYSGVVHIIFSLFIYIKKTAQKIPNSGHYITYF